VGAVRRERCGPVSINARGRASERASPCRTSQLLGWEALFDDSLDHPDSILCSYFYQARKHAICPQGCLVLSRSRSASSKQLIDSDRKRSKEIEREITKIIPRNEPITKFVKYREEQRANKAAASRCFASSFPLPLRTQYVRGRGRSRWRAIVHRLSSSTCAIGRWESSCRLEWLVGERLSGESVLRDTSGATTTHDKWYLSTLYSLLSSHGQGPAAYPAEDRQEANGDVRSPPERSICQARRTYHTGVISASLCCFSLARRSIDRS